MRIGGPDVCGRMMREKRASRLVVENTDFLFAADFVSRASENAFTSEFYLSLLHLHSAPATRSTSGIDV